jgi:hypothetical protein
MCIFHDFGVVMDLKWCPFSVYEIKGKLGILAVLFSDGEVRLFVIPHPLYVREQESIPMDHTIYCK